MTFSIIIPARNEERHLPACLESIHAAARVADRPVEIIVVLNRCTDRTEQIAQGDGARIVREDARNLSRIRNAGAACAGGEVLCTLDADSRMAPNTFTLIEQALRTGECAGGGVAVRPERLSLGIILTGALLMVYVAATRTFGGLFWCRRSDFEAIGGFDERCVSAEDLDFAKRLRQHARRTRRRCKTLWRAPITTSCRKFDEFGDWYLLRHPVTTLRLLGGRDQRRADLFYYNFKR